MKLWMRLCENTSVSLLDHSAVKSLLILLLIMILAWLGLDLGCTPFHAPIPALGSFSLVAVGKFPPAGRESKGVSITIGVVFMSEMARMGERERLNRDYGATRSGQGRRPARMMS